ncbi:hypothetical protein EX30DRAFT_372177 [Ascodesmis nigricans]|uniref:Uncharacterized protein n=1 Tax=Ascodesmis nigricans TaxID=341454 RepID=A0A4S2MVK3_9PEZI|nr:hypothetical protein EX30DRAFT_372177 [Ascodesmis nigricans]
MLFSFTAPLLLLSSSLVAALPAQTTAKYEIAIPTLDKSSTSLICSNSGVSAAVGAVVEIAYRFCNDKIQFADAWPAEMPIEQTKVVTGTPYYHVDSTTVPGVNVHVALFNLLPDQWRATVNDCYTLSYQAVTGCPDGKGGAVSGTAFKYAGNDDKTHGKHGVVVRLEKRN